MKTKTKTIVAALAAVVLGLPAAGPAAAQGAAVIGTGGATGVYYAVGVAICRLMDKELARRGARCSVERTGGSISNVSVIRSGAANFGIVQSDVQYHAVNGLSHFRESGPDEDLRAVFSVLPEALTVVAHRDAGVDRFEDFRGKRYNIGNPGSGTRETTTMLMRELGMDVGDFALASEYKPDEQGAALCDGSIDGFGYMVGSPVANIQEVMTACGGRLIPLSGPAIDRLIAENPYFIRATIPGGMYWGNPGAVETFGVMASLMTSARVPDDLVHAVVAAVFDNLEEFKKLHPALAGLDVEEMIRGNMQAPLHAGALRYYREKGWM
ncbi:MAG: TAXI family TRAP transporter solute-binding subunit [Candidatus Accumulibacter sp.]|nr:TAXI family TRAP transporter solute-binding subunit [Accumulibacter sp.]